MNITGWMVIHTHQYKHLSIPVHPAAGGDAGSESGVVGGVPGCA